MKNTVLAVKTAIRRVMRHVAMILNRISGGRLTPNTVTWLGFIMHVPVALLIASDHLVLGGITLIIFGLFDTLDGELARLQNRVSDSGGFLDASTDRFKEVLLYSAAAYWFAANQHPALAAIAVAACGASICVSYVKAKGEAIVAASGKEIPYPELNRMFSSGLFPFEIRMTVLAAGLLLDKLVWAVAIIALFSALTAFQRLLLISRRIA